MDGRFRKRLIYFLVVAALSTFVAGLLQTSFLPQLGLFGAVPDLVLILTCGAAFYLGPVDGGLMGLVGGIMIEGFGGYGVALAPLVYFAFGVVFGVISAKMFRGKFRHYLIYGVIFCAAKAGYSIARIVCSPNGDRVVAAFFRSVLPESIGTLLLAMILFVPVRGLAGLLRGRMDVKKGKGGLGDL